MAGIIVWLIILAVIAAGGSKTVLWAYLGLTALVVIGALTGNVKKQPKNGEGNTFRRIDRLHYLDPDEYECPRCGAKFRKNVMTCPRCGISFTGKVTDDEEFIEEMEIWEEDDDE